MPTANKCGLQKVHVAVIGRYLSLPATAHLSASDNVGSTFYFPPHGSKKTEITGNIYAVLRCNHKDKAGERKEVWEVGRRGEYHSPRASRCVFYRESGEIEIEVCFCSDMDEELLSADQSADRWEGGEGREAGSVGHEERERGGKAGEELWRDTDQDLEAALLCPVVDESSGDKERKRGKRGEKNNRRDYPFPKCSRRRGHQCELESDSGRILLSESDPVRASSN